SKCFARKGVRVQVPLSAPPLRERTRCTGGTTQDERHTMSDEAISGPAETSEPEAPSLADEPGTSEVQTAEREAGEADRDGSLRILVAEDEAIIRLDLAEMLAEAGHQVVGQANNGEQAVELAKELRPDLVILDVKMPVMDGISAAEAIGKERICPVVMLTAFSQKELVERA